MKVLKRDAPVSSMEAKAMTLTVSAALLLVLLGAKGTIFETGLSYLDGVYVWIMTLTTIGFGDVVIDVEKKHVKLPILVSGFMRSTFILIGLSLVSSALTNLVDLVKGGEASKCFCFVSTSVSPVETNRADDKSSDNNTGHALDTSAKPLELKNNKEVEAEGNRSFTTV